MAVRAAHDADLLVASGAGAPLGVLAGSLLGLLWVTLAPTGGAPLLVPVLGLTALAALMLLVMRVRRRVFLPLAGLREWVNRMVQGEPGMGLPPTEVGVLGPLVRDIDSLREELKGLYEDMDSRVAKQTGRLAQKTASLKILYDVAASINHADGLDDLLVRFLRILKEMVNARGATVRIVEQGGHMRLVGSIGLDNSVLRHEQLLPVQLCLCGTALAPGDILCENNAKYCSRLTGRTMFGSDRIEMIAVPLEYHDDVLGVYNLFVEKPGISGREDILELLTTIGSHLGMAVAKHRSDAQTRRLSILEERTNLSHELHDSLAQTLASLRFQVRMLDESVQQGLTSEAHREVRRLKDGLDEAHGELRELLNSFRAPVDQRGLLPTLETIAKRFQQETGIATFLQSECHQPSLDANQEMQVVRIVQEALNNIRKHSRAHTVRILVRCRASGDYLLLVEDDGRGFDRAAKEAGSPGEHIGLSIMGERARRLGGKLHVESEPGEGTRIELSFRPRLGKALKVAKA